MAIIDLDSTRIITFWHQFTQRLYKKEIEKLSELIAFDEMQGNFGFLLGFQKEKVSKNEFIKSYAKLFTSNVLASLKEQFFRYFEIYPDYKEKKIVRFAVSVIACKEVEGIGGRSIKFLFCAKKSSYQLCVVAAQGGSCD